MKTSVASRWIKAQMKILKPIIANQSIETLRIAQDKIGLLGAKVHESKVMFDKVSFENFKALFVRPKCSDDKLKDKSIILYLHGGGYTCGHLDYAAGFGSVLASKMLKDVLCVAYRLAPEFPFPAAVDDALCAYKYLLDLGYSGDEIFLVGESAGGGLSFSLIFKLKEENLPLPRAIIGLSPWTDLTMSCKSHKFNLEKDPSLANNMLEFYADSYAKDQKENPLVSPLFGSLEGFPPSLIYVGGDEILLDDSKELALKLKKAGSRCEYHEVKGMWHVFVLFGIPEAKNALKRIYTFIREEEKK